MKYDEVECSKLETKESVEPKKVISCRLEEIRVQAERPAFSRSEQGLANDPKG